jgi:pre-mRNA-splicing factor 18
MDFASLMAKTLSKSSTPTPLPTTKDVTPDVKSPTPPKFLSRRELEEQRTAAYLAEQKRLEEERQAKAAAKRKREEEAAEEAKAREEKRRRLADESRKRKEEREAEEERARRKRLGLPELLPESETKQETKVDEEEDLDDDAPDEEEVKTQLRAMGEPITLYGETRATRLRRYMRVAGKVTEGPITTSLMPVAEKDMKVSETVPKPEDKKARRWLFRQLASYFNMVLREWERALAKEGHHDTTAGKQAVSSLLSSKESMKPVCVPL